MHLQLNAFIRDLPFTGNLLHDSQALLTHHSRIATAGHSLRVAAEAKRLALRWNADPVKAEIAGWLHDISAIIPAGPAAGRVRRPVPVLWGRHGRTLQLG